MDRPARAVAESVPSAARLAPARHSAFADAICSYSRTAVLAWAMTGGVPSRFASELRQIQARNVLSASADFRVISASNESPRGTSRVPSAPSAVATVVVGPAGGAHQVIGPTLYLALLSAFGTGRLGAHIRRASEVPAPLPNLGTPAVRQLIPEPLTPYRRSIPVVCG